VRVYRTVTVVGLVASFGCGGGSSAPSTPSSPDTDGDGFTVANGDCNDQNATINPNGKVVVEATVWVNPQYNCPRGSDGYPEDDDVVRLRITNNRCSVLAVTDASAKITVLEAHNTYNFPGETWTNDHARFSPATIAAGVGADVVVEGGSVCTNPGGGDGYNTYQADVTLQTSAGSLVGVTSNSRTTIFGFADSLLSNAAARQGGGRGTPGPTRLAR
jgi:hypothetical protein